jgi:hypothetical protein
VRFTVFALMVGLAARVAAQPAPESIVLAGADPELRIALAGALAPAGMSVIAVGPVPAPAVDALSTASRELADRAHASATVWLLASGGKSTLITYDRERDRVLVREMSYTLPLGPTQAAEVARAARTMLRALRVTPDVDQPPPRVEDAPAIRDIGAVRDTPLLAASAMFGVRLNAPDNDVGGAIAVVWRPDRLGAALVAELAPSADIVEPTFTGTLLDGAVAVLGRMPLAVAPRIRVIPTAGLAIHLVRLHGALDTMEPIRSTRIDPAARLGVAATYEVNPNLDIGVTMSVDCLVSRQRYETGAAEILVIPRLQAMFGAIVTLRVL